MDQALHPCLQEGLRLLLHPHRWAMSCNNVTQCYNMLSARLRAQLCIASAIKKLSCTAWPQHTLHTLR
jgi:hypothetical protein